MIIMMVMIMINDIYMNDNEFIHTVGRAGRGNVPLTFVTIYKHCGMK